MNPYGSAWAEEAEPEIDIMEYVRLVWAKKWLILAVVLAIVVFRHRVVNDPPQAVPGIDQDHADSRRRSSPTTSSTRS